MGRWSVGESNCRRAQIGFCPQRRKGNRARGGGLAGKWAGPTNGLSCSRSYGPMVCRRVKLPQSSDRILSAAPQGKSGSGRGISRKMGWTDERVELLKKLWADGLSASQIAAELRSDSVRSAAREIGLGAGD